MLERIKIHRDDLDLAASSRVLGFVKIVNHDNRSVTIEANTCQRRELIRNGINYKLEEPKWYSQS